MRWIAVLIPLCVACETSIPLGSECPDFEGPCPRFGSFDPHDGAAHTDAGQVDASVPSSPDAEPEHDAASADAELPGDAEPPDAGPADAQSDATSALFPGIRNGSFDLPAEASAPLPLTALGTNNVEWYACRGGISIVSEATTVSGQAVGPADPSTFIVDELTGLPYDPAAQVVGGLMQQLSEPLQAGRLYALEVDVRSDPGLIQAQVELKLGTGPLAPSNTGPFSCLFSSFTELASTGPIPPGAWVTRCLSFTPAQSSNTLTLLGLPGNLGLGQAKLFIDKIRPVAHCP